MIAATAIVVIISKDFPSNTLKEFAELRPCRRKYGHGSSRETWVQSRTTCALLQAIMATNTARVAYTGTVEIHERSHFRQVDFGCDQIVNVVPQVQAGTIKALAIASPERSPALKDVPTAAEARHA